MRTVHATGKGVENSTQVTFEGFAEAIVRLAAVKALPTDKEMRNKGFQYPGEYMGAIMQQGSADFKKWLLDTQRNVRRGKTDPIFRRVDTFVLLMVSIVQCVVEHAHLHAHARPLSCAWHGHEHVYEHAHMAWAWAWTWGVCVLRYGVEKTSGGATLLLRGSPDEIISYEECKRYYKQPTPHVFEVGGSLNEPVGGATNEKRGGRGSPPLDH